MKYSWDYVTEDIAREKKRDMERSRKEGRKEGVLSTAHNFIIKMLENGESIDKIKLYSGCSKTQIEKIRKEANLAM